MGVLSQTPLDGWLQSLDFFGWVFLRRRKRLFTDQVLKRPANHLNPSLHWEQPEQVPVTARSHFIQTGLLDFPSDNAAIELIWIALRCIEEDWVGGEQLEAGYEPIHFFRRGSVQKVEIGKPSQPASRKPRKFKALGTQNL